MTDKERIARIIGDWLDRRDQAEAIAPEEVVRAHPDLAEELRSHFEIIGAIDEPRAEPEVDRRVGDYRILREIGRGGMGVVYEAEQGSMGRRVALKVLSPAVTNTHQAVRRFRREARAAGQIHHTNIVPIYGMGEDGGLHYYAMELVEGETLAEVVASVRERREAAGEADPGDGPLGLSGSNGDGHIRLAEAMAGVAEALDAAHQEGVIHRDVKPTNLILARDGTLKIVDFGLARLAGEGASMTMTGQLIGTPHYMSPEQATVRSVPIDHRTDVYSLGATLYEVLTFRTPFLGDTLQELCSQIIAREPPPVRRIDPKVPRDLETIVAKAMEKEREKRYATAGEMARDLRRFAEGLPIRARRIGPAGRAWRKVKRNKVRSTLVAAVVLLAAVGFFLGLRATRETERRTDLEYAALCAEAEEAVARGTDLGSGDGSRAGSHSGEAVRLFTDAIALRPERPEAWFGRAIASGRTLDERFADLDEARERGLPEGVWHLARARLFRSSGRLAEAVEEAGRAPARATSPAECYFRALLLAEDGETEEAERLFTRAVGAADGGALRYFALRQRARLREGLGDASGALQDLHAVQSLGHDSLSLRLALARLWRRMGRQEDAEAALERALETVRSEGDAARWAALCRAVRTVPSWHETVTEAALERHADDPWFINARLGAVGRAGRYDEALALVERLEEIDPEDHKIHEARAMHLRLLGRSEDAIASYRRALEIDPTCGSSGRRLGALLFESGRLEDALAAFDATLARHPENDWMHVWRGRTLARLGRPEEALAVLDRVIARRPTHVVAHRVRWRLLREADREDEANAAMERILDLGQGGADALTLRAQAFSNLGRFEEALAAWDCVLESDPDLVYAYIWRAVALGELGRDDEALATLDRALEVDPHYAEGKVHGVRAVVLLSLGRLDEALAATDRALQLGPGDARTLVVRGEILLGLGRSEEAVEALDRVIRLEPERTGAHGLRGDALIGLGRTEEALAAYERTVELAPDEPRSHSSRARALVGLRRWDEAVASARRALVLDPRCVPAHRALAGALHGRGENSEALAVLRKAIEIDREQADVHALLGSVLRALGRPEEALEAFDEALRLDPVNAETHNNRGALLCDLLGRHREALAAFQRALDIRPELGWTHANRGAALVGLGLPHEALKAFDRALELGQEEPRVHMLRGNVLRALGRDTEALKAYAAALCLDPDDVETLIWRGAILCDRLGKPAEALKEFDEALRLDPENAVAHGNRAVALCSMGLVDAALEAAERSVKCDPDYAGGHLQRGIALYSQGRSADALGALDTSLAMENRPIAHLFRGRVLVALQRPGEARSAFERATGLAPGLADAHFWLGWTLLGQRQHADALRSLRRTIELAPEFLPARYYAASALRHLGRLKEARKLAAESVRGLTEPPPQLRDTVAWLCAVAGERERAVAFLRPIEAAVTGEKLYNGACIHALLGDADEALRWLERAVEAGCRIGKDEPPDPDFAGLEEDPRYRALRARLVEDD